MINLYNHSMTLVRTVLTAHQSTFVSRNDFLGILTIVLEYPRKSIAKENLGDRHVIKCLAKLMNQL